MDAVAFIEFLEDRETWSFGYGREPKTHDCVRFASAGVKAAHGADPLAEITSTWTTEAGAARALKRHGGMAEAVSSVMRRIDPSLAQRADVVLRDDDGLSLVEGDQLVGAGASGLVRHPLTAAVAAWTVRPAG